MEPFGEPAARLEYLLKCFIEARERLFRLPVREIALALREPYDCTIGGEQTNRIQPPTVIDCASQPAGEKKRIDPWIDAA